MMKYVALLIFLIEFNICTASIFSDTTIIKTHLFAITKTAQPRTFDNIEQLNNTVDYIKSIFCKYSDSIKIQDYAVNNRTYKNVICSFGTENYKRIIIGAHYDVCGNQQGADDNASGIVGLLELARLLKDQKLKYRIDLVAYPLEEPPYFRTKQMGSYVHAKFLYDNHIDVYGMIAFDMIGYFNDEKNTQTYPLKILSLFYGSRGNYITLVKKFGSGKFVRKFCRKFISTDKIRTKKFTGPKFLPGIDFSDHLNYWLFGFNAMMITDTAFYRNKNYHERTDTIETLDIKRMANVIDAVYESLLIM